MVEIILRKDIQDYEARPLFGFTYRQVATGRPSRSPPRAWGWRSRRSPRSTRCG
ncbi:MAG: hypothetical protein ACLT98_02610 [Eggerthellaceae bacterium]